MECRWKARRTLQHVVKHSSHMHVDNNMSVDIVLKQAIQ